MVEKLQAFFDNHFKNALLEEHLLRTFSDDETDTDEEIKWISFITDQWQIW